MMSTLCSKHVESYIIILQFVQNYKCHYPYMMIIIIIIIII